MSLSFLLSSFDVDELVNHLKGKGFSNNSTGTSKVRKKIAPFILPFLLFFGTVKVQYWIFHLRHYRR